MCMAYTYFESYLFEFKTQNVNNLCLLVKLVPESAQMHVCHRSASCLVSYLRLRPLGDLGGGWIGLMVFVCSRPQHSQLCTQRLSPGSAFTGADIDPDLHSHFQSHFAKLLLFITHIKTLNGHIGHTYTCWSFAGQGEMQVAEDKLLWFNQRENNTIFIWADEMNPRARATIPL